MTRAEAEEAARTNAREHADRATHQWVPKKQPDGSWTVLKLKMPPGMRLKPLKATTEAKPEPPQPDDPRPAHIRNSPGAWG